MTLALLVGPRQDPTLLAFLAVAVDDDDDERQGQFVRTSHRPDGILEEAGLCSFPRRCPRGTL
ncbi:hypothetical protein PR003_g4050 [Phytophthora rubi]|uniref:Uncharacterized protein n=2 Tax=Phytophthora rubi TaxID=129364 RepID=A0A6A3N7H5_9STRA|nr:hypothetical protein PR002_g5090 [Phytophthora rubi]KAE9045275.1 hypothetical protein PR001_g5043 [Phytophthora rubi]KAE9353090.1 hypothetical protein PR003_g4050 [Phytophthora rubi]